MRKDKRMYIPYTHVCQSRAVCVNLHFFVVLTRAYKVTEQTKPIQCHCRKRAGLTTNQTDRARNVQAHGQTNMTVQKKRREGKLLFRLNRLKMLALRMMIHEPNR